MVPRTEARWEASPEGEPTGGLPSARVALVGRHVVGLSGVQAAAKAAGGLRPSAECGLRWL